MEDRNLLGGNRLTSRRPLTIGGNKARAAILVMSAQRLFAADIAFVTMKVPLQFLDFVGDDLVQPAVKFLAGGAAKAVKPLNYLRNDCWTTSEVPTLPCKLGPSFCCAINAM